MPTIQIKDNGPYQVSGAFEIIDAEGNIFKTEGDVSLCRCGRLRTNRFVMGLIMIFILKVNHVPISN